MNANKTIKLLLSLKDKQCIKILEQLPKGIRSMYIEKAILNFSKSNPKIEFFFDGFTKPKRKRRTKEEMQNIKSSKKADAEQNIDSSKNETRSEELENSSKMMFNFTS